MSGAAKIKCPSTPKNKKQTKKTSVTFCTLIFSYKTTPPPNIFYTTETPLIVQSEDIYKSITSLLDVNLMWVAASVKLKCSWTTSRHNENCVNPGEHISLMSKATAGVTARQLGENSPSFIHSPCVIISLGFERIKWHQNKTTWSL